LLSPVRKTNNESLLYLTTQYIFSLQAELLANRGQGQT
jgi:hypothetical protein